MVGPSVTSGGFVFGPRHASFTSWLSSINAFLRGQSAPFRDLPSILADPCARQAKGHRIATRSSASQQRRVHGRRNERGKGYWLQLSPRRGWKKGSGLDKDPFSFSHTHTHSPPYWKRNAWFYLVKGTNRLLILVTLSKPGPTFRDFVLDVSSGWISWHFCW